MLKDSWWSLQVIHTDFLSSQCTECAHILKDAQSAFCYAATWLSGLTKIYINEILIKDKWQSLQVIYNEFLLQQCTECAHILENVQSASCDAATWFAGLI
jgi:hypothetical protein